MNEVYLIYDEEDIRHPKVIAVVANEEIAIEYCSTDGRTRFYQNENLFGHSRMGYCLNPLRYKKMSVIGKILLDK